MPAVAESCGTCNYFLMVVKVDGKGVCRCEPPRTADDRNATPIRNDGNGRRWPLCWTSEWCGKWTKVVQ